MKPRYSVATITTSDEENLKIMQEANALAKLKHVTQEYIYLIGCKEFLQSQVTLR